VTKFIIGLFLDPQPEDNAEQIADEYEAISRASERSQAERNTVIAVWDTDDDLHWIFIDGEQFNPV